MKRKTIKGKSQDKPVGELTEISDFLPPPAKLVSIQDTVKVTLSLDRRSLQFFKEVAAKHGAKYQRMIREVLKGYAEHYMGRH